MKYYSKLAARIFLAIFLQLSAFTAMASNEVSDTSTQINDFAGVWYCEPAGNCSATLTIGRDNTFELNIVYPPNGCVPRSEITISGMWWLDGEKLTIQKKYEYIPPGQDPDLISVGLPEGPLSVNVKVTLTSNTLELKGDDFVTIFHR